MPEPVAAGAFHRVTRAWHGRTELRLRLPMPLHVERRPAGSVSIARGPLVYALAVGEDWRPVTPYNRSAPTADPRIAHDYEVYPTSGWNYALQLDPERPDDAIVFEERPLGEQPFASGRAAAVAHVRGRLLPDWTVEHGAAGPVPASPASSDAPLEDLELVPYGCTRLRITEFPVLES